MYDFPSVPGDDLTVICGNDAVGLPDEQNDGEGRDHRRERVNGEPRAARFPRFAQRCDLRLVLADSLQRGFVFGDVRRHVTALAKARRTAGAVWRFCWFHRPR